MEIPEAGELVALFPNARHNATARTLSIAPGDQQALPSTASSSNAAGTVSGRIGASSAIPGARGGSGFSIIPGRPHHNLIGGPEMAPDAPNVRRSPGKPDARL